MSKIKDGDNFRVQKYSTNCSNDLQYDVNPTFTNCKMVMTANHKINETKHLVKGSLYSSIPQSVLAHSNINVNPVNSIFEAKFCSEIFYELKSLNVRTVGHLQRYAWPHILSRNSACIIDAPNTGRTWSYLPAICNSVYNKLRHDTMCERNCFGPIAIIVVATVSKAQFMRDHCRTFLQSSNSNLSLVVSAYSGQRNIDICVDLHNGCGILVATPTQLNALLIQNQHEGFFKKRRLRHIVVDDIDLIHSNDPCVLRDLVSKLFRLCKVKKKGCIKQIVIVAESWNNAILPSLIARMRNPLVLFGDFLQATVYGQINIIIRTTQTKLKSKKQKFLYDFLQKWRNFPERTVIFCNKSSEILEICEVIQQSGHKFLLFGKNNTLELRQKILKWKTELTNEILICTSINPEIQIKNAYYLIFYALPGNFAMFKRRFSVLEENIHNFVANEYQIKNTVKNDVYDYPYRVILLADKSNSSILQYLVEFLQQQKQDASNQLNEIAANIKYRRDVVFNLEEISLCSELLTYGNCIEPHCKKRHMLSYKDLPTSKYSLPTEGYLMLKILKVYSPVHYAIQLLKHKPLAKKSSWHDLPHLHQCDSFAFELSMYCAQSNNLKQYGPPNLNDICLYKRGYIFERVQILQINLNRQPNEATFQFSFVVKSLDLSNDIMNARTKDLFICPDKFLTIPPTAVELHVLGMVPYYGERTWECYKGQHLLEWLDTTDIVQIQINYSLKNAVFTKNLFTIERLKSYNTYISKLNLKKELYDAKIAKTDDVVYNKVIKLFKEIKQTQYITQTAASEEEDYDSDCSITSFSSIHSYLMDSD